MEDTGIQQVDPTNVQIQDVDENTEIAEVDTSKQQAQVVNTDSQVDEEPEIPEDQTSAIDDEQDNTIQFGNLVTQPFLSRSVRVPI